MGNQPAQPGGKVKSGGIVVIAAALPMEVSGILGPGTFKKAYIGSLKYYRGDVRGTDAALFVSGVGDIAAYETAKAACSALPLTAYISVGLSGALSPVLKPGDVVLGELVRSVAGSATVEYRTDPALLAAAKKSSPIGGRPVTGQLLCSPTVIVTSGEKMQAAGSSGCIAVDMETAGAARAASEAGVPFMAVRVISDALDEDLPVDFNRFTCNGKMDYLSLIFHVITHPGTILPLIRLGRNSRLAAKNLALTLGTLLPDIKRTPF